MSDLKWEDNIDLSMRKSSADVDAGEVSNVAMETSDIAWDYRAAPRKAYSTGAKVQAHQNGVTGRLQHDQGPKSKANGNARQKRDKIKQCLRKNSLATAREMGSISLENEELFDVICIGFGPASLAIAIAMADAYSALPQPDPRLPKALFLEKQEEFAWHSGMQLPEAKMQISFLKDLATPRDPTSPFSFVNYLHSKGRLSQFINLDTFLPSRLEYEDYMRWCADHFEASVLYGKDVERVKQSKIDPATGRAKAFTVFWKDASSSPASETFQATARHVIVAAGGRPYMPKEFQALSSGPWPKINHSSQYAFTIGQWKVLKEQKCYAEREHKRLWKEGDLEVRQHNERLQAVRKQKSDLPNPNTPSDDLKTTDQVHVPGALQTLETETKQKLMDLKAELDAVDARFWKTEDAIRDAGIGEDDEHKFVVIGNGQSAVEIFNDLWTRFPEAEVTLIIKGAALKPSDDSPFVNEIFDPERVDGIYSQNAEERAQSLLLDRGTNYGVVRINLLEHIYEKLYMQRIQQPDDRKWKHRIITNRVTTSVEQNEDKDFVIKLAQSNHASMDEKATSALEQVVASHVFVATGYLRNAHEEILKDTVECLPASHQSGHFSIGRDYRVLFDKRKVDDDCGVWLQGCNEKTHGLADSLLSIIAIRGGEIVSSIFGDDLKRQAEA
ncbi:MAG: hypothetical protein M1818_004301 [Claussenomyces sp. TS43310]|nr:MAG: hypothetical protein M1818_004301 [Claussenomyces sp. TS43310]